uniref:BED-type domain-containing protein n=1 Tax=Ditylenchus dipsaci TaxID=166011 RepID=A0A915EAF3_9BILA
MSSIWKIVIEGDNTKFLFTSTLPTEANCNACQKQIKTLNKGVTHLKQHLAKHPNYKKQYEEMEKIEDEKKEAMKQSMKQFVIRGTTHKINLVVNHFLLKNVKIEPMLESCRKLDGHFSHSILAKDRLKEEQKTIGLKQHSILQVPRRLS